MAFRKVAGLAAALMCTTSMAFAQSAPNTVNLVFVVDESGSMSGEHAFLGGVATDIEASLNASGINNVNYGLIGYGSSANTAGYVVSGLGSAANFAAATGQLVTSGSTEDGYSGLNLALSNFGGGSAPTTFVLVTDEDRDILDPSLSFASIDGALKAQNIGLVVVVNASLTDSAGGSAIATDGQNALIQAGSSFTVTNYGGVAGASGTTEADYIDLALNQSAGCAADLNVLRNGGDSATAFSEVFVSCLTEVATVLVTTSRGRTIALPLTNFARTGLAILVNHNGAVRGIVFVRPRDAGVAPPTVTRNSTVFDNAFGVEGLRMYSAVNGYTGSFDGTDTAAAYDYDGGGIIIGTDYTYDIIDAGTARFGLNVGWSRTDTNEADSDNSADQEGVTLGLYGGFWSEQDWYTFASLQYGMHDLSNRRVDSGTTFTASPDNALLAGELEFGYTYTPAVSGITGLTPFVGVGFVESQISGYDEDNGGVSIEDYSQFSSYGKLGARLGLEQATDSGTYFGAVELAGLFPMDDDDTTVQVSNDTTSVIEASDDPQASLTLEAGLRFSPKGQVYAQYNGLYSDKLTQHGVTLGVDYSF